MLGLDGQDGDQSSAYTNRLKLSYIFLKEEDDALVWSWSPSGDFSACFGYKAMFLNEDLDA